MPIMKQGDALLTSGSAVASSEACCCQASSDCQCNGGYANDVTVSCEFTVTLKAGQTNATTGTATQTITLSWDGTQYIGTGTITAVGPADLSAQMYCLGGQFEFLASVNMCAYNVAFDLPGSALGGCGGGCTKTMPTGTLVDGRCVPPDERTAQYPEDAVFPMDPADVGLEFDVQFIVTGP